MLSSRKREVGGGEYVGNDNQRINNDSFKEPFRILPLARLGRLIACHFPRIVNLRHLSKRNALKF